MSGSIPTSSISFSGIVNAYNNVNTTDLPTTNISLSSFRSKTFSDSTTVPSSGAISLNSHFKGKTWGGGGLYSFSSHTFTNCGKTGRDGPTLSECRSSYSPSWTDNTSYFNVTGSYNGIQIWTVPETAEYEINAYGAQGGWQYYNSTYYYGGEGARIQGVFLLIKGDKYRLVVGQEGEPTQNANGWEDNAAAGGGGGTFIWRESDETLLIAAGGGGAGFRTNYSDRHATSSESGFGAEGLSNGGSNGNGGKANNGGSSYWAGGGAGWITDGTGGNQSTDYNTTGGSYGGAGGGMRPRAGARGGDEWNDGRDEGGKGGFGGGGGGGSDNMGTGGGGGYSGGGGGRSGKYGGGGGGSFLNQSLYISSYGWIGSSYPDGRQGHGKITITKLGAVSDLYSFSTHTFTNCGVTGKTGPTLSQCRASYSPSWTDDTAYFNVTQTGFQIWTVPTTASYTIEAWGASGGNDNHANNVGGFGTKISGKFTLASGDKYMILVGQVGLNGTYGCGSGGGGSFVVKGTDYSSAQTSDVLIVAGGGGGAGWNNTSAQINARTGTSGGYTYDESNNLISGGTNGNGGNADTGTDGSAGGGGFLTDGVGSYNGGSGSVYRGLSFKNGGNGGTGAQNGDGGFGGGGGIHGNHTGGGGGGGYSGGAGGSNYHSDPSWSGGGGGSYNTGTEQSNTVLVAQGDGKIIITKV